MKLSSLEQYLSETFYGKYFRKQQARFEFSSDVHKCIRAGFSTSYQKMYSNSFNYLYGQKFKYISNILSDFFTRISHHLNTPEDILWIENRPTEIWLDAQSKSRLYDAAPQYAPNKPKSQKNDRP